MKSPSWVPPMAPPPIEPGACDFIDTIPLMEEADPVQTLVASLLSEQPDLRETVDWLVKLKREYELSTVRFVIQFCAGATKASEIQPKDYQRTIDLCKFLIEMKGYK